MERVIAPRGSEAPPAGVGLAASGSGAVLLDSSPASGDPVVVAPSERLGTKDGSLPGQETSAGGRWVGSTERRGALSVDAFPAGERVEP